MENIYLSLTNCFGIESLEYEFDFAKGNTFVIYAKNGMMKTSFAKTFQAIQKNKRSEIRDAIYDKDGIADVKIDGVNILPSQVFVIKSYESSYESDISSLLIKEEIQNLLIEVFEILSKLLKALENCSGLKIKRTQNYKTVYELEPTIIEDFGFREESILTNLEALDEYESINSFGDIKYDSIFDSSVYKKITSDDFQQGIKQFVDTSEKIYESFPFLEKGGLTLPKLKELKKAIDSNSLFVKENYMYLSGLEPISDIETLDKHIATIQKKVLESPEYNAIEKMLSDSKGRKLKDVIETHPEIVEYLLLENLETLRKVLWKSYLKDNVSLFNELKKKYQELSTAINNVNLDNTPWKAALDIFNKRFTVPFSMEIANLKSAIIGESVPKVEFTFTNGTDKKTIDRSDLDHLDTLSQGEKRALYLLNIIFDVEQLKQSGKEVLLIVDDIADSFDYKNKYAIIEYLYELAENEDFHMLILTHNYDFFRTVGSRLSINYDNQLIAKHDSEKIQLTKKEQHREPYDRWKKTPCEKNVIALVPFVRNLVQYGRDRNYSKSGSDYLYLTALLHNMPETHSITFGDLRPIYKEYLDVSDFNDDVVLTEKVIDCLYTICDGLTDKDDNLENKIVLAMGIRHCAEEIMITEIAAFTGQLKWKKQAVSSDEFLAKASKKNQTRELLKGYKQIGAKREKIKLFEEVNIMTPENIHFNSFMYEPLIDMDIVELLNLYKRLKEL